MENQFYKVGTRGMTYEVAIMYNPFTNEEKTITIYDNDQYNPIVNDEFYYMPVNEEAKKIYQKKILFQFEKGDKVQIVSGRKMKGEIKIISKTFKYKVHSGLFIDYVVFDDNTKVQAEYCNFLGV